MSDPNRNCGRCTQREDTPLSALNADAVEFGFLSAARCFFVSFSGPHEDAWVKTMLGSSYFFPGADSAEHMRLTLAVVHEMRISRRSTFRFSNPYCEECASRVTQDERHLLQLVQHARAHRVSMLASSALLLCEGHATDRVIAAACAFAASVDKSSPAPAPAGV